MEKILKIIDRFFRWLGYERIPTQIIVREEVFECKELRSEVNIDSSNMSFIDYYKIVGFAKKQSIRELQVGIIDLIETEIIEKQGTKSSFVRSRIYIGKKKVIN
jgi:hypothetical protein